MSSLGVDQESDLEEQRVLLGVVLKTVKSVKTIPLRNQSGTSGSETADRVNIEVESPSEDELRVANFLAEEHSEAETIALSSEDTIEVREASGGSFKIDVTEVMEREFGESSGPSTQASSVPSMSTAVAEKLG